MALTYTPGAGWNTGSYRTPGIDLSRYANSFFKFYWKDKGPYNVYLPTTKAYTVDELRTLSHQYLINKGIVGPNSDRVHLKTSQTDIDSFQNDVTNYSTKLAENKAIEQKNAAYDTALQIAGSTQGGDYTARRELIRNLNLDATAKATLENNFKTFYTVEKLSTWDPALGARPPYGTFDPTYYKQQNPTLTAQWSNAVANDDIDITLRYGENGFYLQHYTTQGKPAGLRGNNVESTTQSNQYVENAPTDADLQAVRALQLGADTDTQTTRLLNIPAIAAEWDKAKAGDAYWSQLGKDSFLDLNKPDEFAALFRLSNRPEDQIVRLNYNANAGYGITELEDVLNEAVGEKTIVDVKRFGALTQNVLKETIAEMQKAKQREQELSLYKGFGAFSEITNINKELTNSILGDSGVGGILSQMGGDGFEKSLEKSLGNITGVNTNNTIYNWQTWFDETLKTKYQQDIELGYSTKEAEESVKIQASFAKDFIDKYLIPRFNESRSMSEFVEYLDIRQSEQNPFQTQDLMNAAKLVADVRAQAYLDQLKSTPGRYFDSNFYFNPTGNKAKEGAYATQASTVAADWEAAKNGDGYWAQQAYRFGVDLNNKDAFARMHFQVKGQGVGYDPADDILNAGKVSDYIYTQILPALKEEVLKQGSIFGQFITPTEFADEMLKGLDPNAKEGWDEVLKRYGIEDFKGSLEDLKEYIKETLQTGSAQEIRENIKYLNERKERPTQEVLGITYIQRDEDYKNVTATPQTELYKTFQSAGFKGTEDQFYSDFFPDLDRGEQALLTKSGSNSALTTTGLDFGDPFASLGTIENFFDDETIAKANEEPPERPTSSYFRIAMDEEEDATLTKSKSGEAILGEFTSMFKGL
jgi:hypothetical protein